MNIEFLSSAPWTWSNQDGLIYSQKFYLLENGTVGGYSNPNEFRWAYRNNKIVFFDSEGAESAILARDKDVADEIQFRGKSFKDPSGRAEVKLSRTKLRVGCFLRTHFWDESVERSLSYLTDCWGEPVGLVSDKTYNFETPSDITDISGSCAYFQRIGLLDYPTVSNMMWYNGDYVFYLLALNADYDFFLVCEYDLIVKGINLRSVIDGIIETGVDFSSIHVRKVELASWPWLNVQKSWLEAELGTRDGGHEIDIWGGFFPFVLISKAAALYLFGRRIQMAYLARSGQVKASWPFCESFVPTELARAKFRMCEVRDYLPSVARVSHDDVLSWGEVAASDACMFHPVLEGERFASKVLKRAEVIGARDPHKAAEWLLAQLERPIGDAVRGRLEKALVDWPYRVDA